MWGGIECTVNRVGDWFIDQIERSGHADRPDDLDRFADLGLYTLRYPVLWERVAPCGLDDAEWAWVDARMARLRALGITPIVGLVHHGSGPRGTSLLDPGFATGLARFARAFAERHPWVETYTPVNEPLTTARFSGLYGHWYPHGRDNQTFARALVTQCRAVALAMEAVRAVNPAARLVQTEDLGRTWSTPALVYQADFENERRWITWDLLTGHMGRTHPLWSLLVHAGVGEEELEDFLAAPCPPAVIGINHYLTSERFLDEHLHRYPPHTHGGNSRNRFADVEAVRVLTCDPIGLSALLAEAWTRFGLPLAVTEVHLGSTADEQIRWLTEVWDEARRARDAGVDVRAVTAWALLGSFDWPSLLTRKEGLYEPGCFDVRGLSPCPPPSPTSSAPSRPASAPAKPRCATPGGGAGWNGSPIHPIRPT